MVIYIIQVPLDLTLPGAASKRRFVSIICPSGASVNSHVMIIIHMLAFSLTVLYAPL